MSDIDPISVAERMLSRSNLSQKQDFIIDSLDPLDQPVEPKKHYSELPVCNKCQGSFFLAKEGEGGAISADPCGCIEKIDWEYQRELRAKAELVSAALVPNRYIKAFSGGKIKKEVLGVAEGLVNGSYDNNFLFFYGGTGSGKTHSAAYVLLTYLQTQASEGKNAFYCNVYQLLEAKRKSGSYDFRQRDLRTNAQHEYNWYLKRLREADLVVLDELGQEKLKPGEKKPVFDIIDHRYSSNLATILISNHCDNKALSLEGKLLSGMVGSRISSRLKSAKHIYFAETDFRKAEHSEIITEKDVKGFKLSSKILTHSPNTHQIMTWLARNPAFEVVSTNQRKELTYIDQEGEEKDKDRPSASFYRDVWVNGDSLQINGPVCDHEDKKLYALLLKELSTQHREGELGLSLEISLHQIIKLLKLRNSGENTNRIKRQLNRLSRMAMTFKNSKGNRWDGPLITEVLYIGNSSDQRVRVSFSHFMITFYRLHEYTSFSHDKSKLLKGDSSAFYLFYSSHSLSKMSISVDRCKRLLGIPPEFDKKEALKRVKRAVKNLISSGVMDPDGTFVKDGKVHTLMAISKH